MPSVVVPSVVKPVVVPSVVCGAVVSIGPVVSGSLVAGSVADCPVVAGSPVASAASVAPLVPAAPPVLVPGAALVEPSLAPPAVVATLAGAAVSTPVASNEQASTSGSTPHPPTDRMPQRNALRPDRRRVMRRQAARACEHASYAEPGPRDKGRGSCIVRQCRLPYCSMTGTQSMPTTSRPGKHAANAASALASAGSS